MFFSIPKQFFRELDISDDVKWKQLVERTKMNDACIA